MPDTASLLEDAANRIADISRADLQVLLRRAALLLRNSGSITFEDRTEEALRILCSDLGLPREDGIRYVMWEWMEQNAYLPVHELDEDGEVDGEA